MATLPSTSYQSLLPSEEYAHHPYVKFSCGADTRLHHKPSGITLHVHGCFLGEDLDEAALDELLGECTHLDIGQIIDFFETIEFVPGVGASQHPPLGPTTKCFNALLVAVTLHSEALVRELTGAFTGTDKNLPASLDYAVFKSLIRHRAAYPLAFVKHILPTASRFLNARTMFKSGIITGVYDDLFDLAVDTDYGPKYYAQLILYVQMTSVARVVNKKNGKCVIGVDGLGLPAAPPPSDSRTVLTVPWSTERTEYFERCCEPHSLDNVVIAVDTGYISRVHSLAALPFTVSVAKDADSGAATACTLTTREHCPDIVSVLGARGVQKGATVLLQIASMTESSEGVEQCFGVVASCSPTSVTVVDLTGWPRRGIPWGGCIAHILDGAHAGHHFGSPREGPGPGMWCFLTKTGGDRFLSSANFVVRVETPEEDEEGELASSVGTFTDHCALLVHDWVMYRRWPYFRRMIDSGMLEASTRTLTLPAEFPHSLLASLVVFLYTGTHPPADWYSAEERARRYAYCVEHGEQFGFGRDELAAFTMPHPDDAEPKSTAAVVGGVRSTITGAVTSGFTLLSGLF